MATIPNTSHSTPSLGKPRQLSKSETFALRAQGAGNSKTRGQEQGLGRSEEAQEGGQHGAGGQPPFAEPSPPPL